VNSIDFIVYIMVRIDLFDGGVSEGNSSELLYIARNVC